MARADKVSRSSSEAEIEEQVLSQQKEKSGPRDHPEQYPTDQESLFDMWESEQHVDPIPMEDLKIEQHDEQEKTKTKNSSSSEKKYNGVQR